MKLLLVAGKDAILVVCNRLFKMIHFVVTSERTLAKELARFLETMCGSCMAYQRAWC